MTNTYPYGSPICSAIRDAFTDCYAQIMQSEAYLAELGGNQNSLRFADMADALFRDKYGFNFSSDQNGLTVESESEIDIAFLLMKF